MMEQKIQGVKINWISNSFLLINLLGFLSCSNQIQKNEKAAEQKIAQKRLLPIFGEYSLGANKDTLFHRISDFSFINQFGDTITEKAVSRKLYVADFFFATCQSICPKMSTQLARIQDTFQQDSMLLLLSHTVNPEYDDVKALHEYGRNYGAVRNKWHLMTGNKKSIYELAKTSYLVNALEDDGTEQGFLHSETFLLIDTARQIRGIYDGTDSLDVNRLIKDINLLKTEMDEK